MLLSELGLVVSAMRRPGPLPGMVWVHRDPDCTDPDCVLISHCRLEVDHPARCLAQREPTPPVRPPAPRPARPPLTARQARAAADLADKGWSVVEIAVLVGAAPDAVEAALSKEETR